MSIEQKLFIPVNQIFILEICDLGDKESDSRFNPRGLENGGFSPEAMERLRNAIKVEGLDTPLLVKKLDKGYGLLAGERRLRSILQLVEDEEQCYNPITRKIESAVQIYIDVGVECKIKECKTEIEYLCISIGENVLHEPLTDYDLLIQLDRMERANVARPLQAKTMHKSEAWVSQSHSILSSHPQIISLMKSGKLSRTAAITFINIPKDKIEDVLNKAIEITFADAEKKIVEGLQEREVAIEELEEASTTLSIAQFTGDEPVVKKVRRSLADAGKKLTRAEKKIDNGKKNKTIITDANILSAAREVKGAGNKIKRTRTIKEVRSVAEQLEKDIKAGEVVDPETSEIVDVETAKIVLKTLKWVLEFQESKSPISVSDDYDELKDYELNEINDDYEEENEDEEDGE